MTGPTPQAGAPATTPAQNRIAGAPISWGVCEVPNWGYQLTPERVLAEMQDVGLSATELGPDGFLPADPQQMATVLDTHQLTAVGGFTPVLMHQAGHDPLPEIDRILTGYDATHAEVLVLSAVSGLDGYDTRPILDDDGWTRLLDNLDRIAHLASEHGVRAVLHPHVGTMVETGSEVQRVLEGSSIVAVPGHRAPADRRNRPGRADPPVAGPHRPHPPQGRRQHHRGHRSAPAGSPTPKPSSRGMYRPLGTGDVDVAAS